MSMASEVMKLTLAVLDVSFNSGHYTAIIKWQFLYINNITYIIKLLYSSTYGTEPYLEMKTIILLFS